MAELFGRVAMGPDNYQVNTWTPFYTVNSTTVGALCFDINFSNVTPMSGHAAKTIDVEAKILDRDGNLVQYLLPPHKLEANGTAWGSTQKIVFEPGDRIMVKASDHGICFYMSILKGLRVV